MTGDPPQSPGDGRSSPHSPSRDAPWDVITVFLAQPAAYTLDNTKQLSVTHLCSIILSFARLNFQPSGSEDFFNMVTFLLSSSSSTFLPPLSAERL
ncbi:protein tbrg4 [Limosa lapponica baueri]|uniref:Protein tbrg4 n=1 Tax=Limosa lapponica baueri TaxID=1758121 RepID=A0A2I0SZC3_LIMLA|nr:protein tbrg4 [Limosa lapponica baueri]